MKIDKNTRNSDIEYCIREYVRLIEHREMMRQKWFEGLTMEEIADRHNLSLTRTKKILYEEGDEILERAADMSAACGGVRFSAPVAVAG